MGIHLGDENMDGTAVMKLIRKNEKHKAFKIFSVTAYAENIDFFIDQGFDELYVKPVIKCKTTMICKVFTKNCV